MSTRILQFATNITCGSCVRTTTNFLDDLPGITIWRVDTDDDRKVLTVEGRVDEDAVIRQVRGAGYDIRPLMAV